MGKKKRPTYNPDFKTEAVALVVKQGYSVEKAATNLGISESALRKWLHKAQALGLDPKASEPLEKELRELKRELERTRQERDILKKAMAYFANPRE
jgi:transposase